MTLKSDWIDNLSKFSTLDDLRKSEFHANNHRRILSFLHTPQIRTHARSGSRLSSFLRVAQWNIEKGKRFDSILDCLRNNKILKWADVIILNEADYGMARSRNRHVALELAEQLDMHMAFGPAHFELTKGAEDDLAAEGENRQSLQGNAVLSRYPVLKSSVVSLPVTFEPYESKEKRFGGRSCLWVQLKLGQSVLWVGSVHLELRNTPRCRALQVKHILENLPGGEDGVYLLGGDMNTNGFARGTFWRAIRSVCGILLHSPAQVQKQLLHPENGREPLFEILKGKGFFWNTLNSNEETARTEMDTLEEVDYLPGFLVDGIKRHMGFYDGYFRFKLDWFFGKRVKALNEGQIYDADTGITSLQPGCIYGKNFGSDRISDHLPVYVDLDLR